MDRRLVVAGVVGLAALVCAQVFVGKAVSAARRLRPVAPGGTTCSADDTGGQHAGALRAYTVFTVAPPPPPPPPLLPPALPRLYLRRGQAHGGEARLVQDVREGKVRLIIVGSAVAGVTGVTGHDDADGGREPTLWIEVAEAVAADSVVGPVAYASAVTPSSTVLLAACAGTEVTLLAW